MRSYIHHIDGNPLNNPLDGSNWMVLCAKCHRDMHKNNNCGKTKIADGIHICVTFSSKKKIEILSKVNYTCQRCGASLSILNFNEIYRCNWCNKRCGKKECIKWDDERIMCNECFNEWDGLGRPGHWWPSRERTRRE